MVPFAVSVHRVVYVVYCVAELENVVEVALKAITDDGDAEIEVAT